jgi:hypothetical protein
LVKRARELIDALRDADGGVVHQLVSNLSQSQRLLAPLALAVGGIDMLFSAVRMLVLNWRLMLVQVLPVTLTWLAMYDLKAYALAGNSDPGLEGPILIPIALAIIAVTAASFFMNSVFAFAVSQPGRPQVRPAITQARGHLGVILGSGAVVGLMLALATTVISRDNRPWFVLALGATIGVMMLGYVAVPARRLRAPRRTDLIRLKIVEL